MIESAWRSLLLMVAMAVVVGVLSVYRLPAEAPWWLGAMRPFWISLWGLYWVIAWNGRIGIVVLFPLGLVADVLIGTPFGLHAALLACAAWVGLQFGEVFRSGPIPGQFLVVLVLFVVTALLQGEVLFLMSASTTPFSFLGGALASTLVWMLLAPSLRRAGPPPALERQT